MRTKKAISLLFIFLYSLNALAYDFMAKTPSGHLLCYDTTKNGTAKVVAKESQEPSYKELTGDLVIPEKIIYNQHEYKVVSIGERAFFGCNELLSITLPITIKNIEENAFFNCTKLNAISLPDSLCFIGSFAFYKCTSLKNLLIPKHVMSIGRMAFALVPDVEYNGKYSTNKPWGCIKLNGVKTSIQDNSSRDYSRHNSSRDKSTNSFSSRPNTSHRNTPHDENWYRNYFKEHLNELDPIEGIYSVSSLISSVNVYNKSYSEEDIFTVVIIKKNNGEFFDIKSLSNNNNRNSKMTMKLYPIGETEVYNFIATWGVCDEKAVDRIILDNLFGFKFSYKLPNCVMKYAANKSGHWELNYTTITVQNTYIKSYPTKSMYETAITNTPETQPSAWSGTGYAIGGNYIVTNNHVIDGAKTISIKGIKGDFNTGYTAEIVATDKVNDIAVLKISDNQFSGLGVIPYSVSTRMADVGEDAFVLGYPLTQALGNEIKLTNGIISSRTGYQGDIATYQISAPVQPGNSGGPMFDSKGNVIGIVVAGVPGAENVGYAIKTSYLKILIESAGLNIHFPANNTISALSLPEKVKRIKNFVYYIECSK